MKRKMLFWLLTVALMASVCFAMATTAWAAESGYYTYTVSNGQATITGVSSDLIGTATIPSSVNGYTVVAIGRSAFSGKLGIKKVVIPNTVITIDNYAFYGCSSITDLTIGSKVTSIGYSAFQGCTGLKAISIPNSVTEIKDDAFNGCTRMASSNKIVSGYSNGKFGVGDKLTREQLVTILYNYAKLKGCNMSVTAASKAKLKAFSDGYKVTGYAQTPCAWALQKGVLGGLNDTTFGPQNYANRAQVAQILMNIVKNKVIPF